MNDHDRNSRRTTQSQNAGVSQRICATLLAVFLLPLNAGAQDATALEGDWLLTLTDRGRVHTGILTFERDGSNVLAFVDGGSVPLGIDGDAVGIEIDIRDGGGRLLSYGLQGHWTEKNLAGILTPPLDAPAGTWRAERIADSVVGVPARPVDFSGIWSRTSAGIAKVQFDYTPAA